MAAIREIHEAIIAAIREGFPQLAQVANYDLAQFQSPCALVRLAEIIKQESDGTNRLAMQLSWEIHCVLSKQTIDVEIEVREFATAIMQKLDTLRFVNLEFCEKPFNVMGQEGFFSEDAEHGYESMIVTFDLIAYLGETRWKPDSTLPTEVWVGVTPLTGLPNKENYELTSTNTTP